MYTLNGHRNTRHTKIHGNWQHVGSEPQWALRWYINCENTKMVHHKMKYLESPHCLPSYEELCVYSEDCGRM